jgi:hypothetical protein
MNALLAERVREGGGARDLRAISDIDREPCNPS